VAKRTPAKSNEVTIKEKEDDYFHRQDDPYVLPPELNMSIKDGFRFGIGFILAMLIFYALVLVGLIIFVRVAKVIR
jgi:hypothetical protein